MLEEVVNGSLSGGAVLCAEAQEGKHSKTSVLDFLELEVSNAAGAARGEAENIESISGVSRHTSALER